MWVVYKATNKITWDSYIWSTKKTLAERQRHHRFDAKYQRRHSRFQKAINDYWWDNFQWDILFESSNEKELREKEEEFIAKESPKYNTVLECHIIWDKFTSYKWEAHHNFWKAMSNRRRVYNRTLNKIYESWAEATVALLWPTRWRTVSHSNTDLSKICRWVYNMAWCELRYIDDDWNIIFPYTRVRKKRTTWYDVINLTTWEIRKATEWDNIKQIRKVCLFTIDTYKWDKYRYIDQNWKILEEKDLYDFVERDVKKVLNSVESKCYAMTKCEDEDTLRENANKPAETVATQRDYRAWELSKSITRKTMPKKILQARDDNYIRWHDADFSALPQINCCLCNLKDMFENWTVLNNKKIEEPKSLRTAATLMTQISMTLTGWQYWWQTFDISHIAKYVWVSYEKIKARIRQNIPDLPEDQLITLSKAELKDEIKDAVQTIQYQLITMKATGWQTPFVTLWLQVYDDYYPDETAMLIEEIFKQRIAWVPNAEWHNITVAFPKLIYVLDENNIKEDSKYYWLTELAAKCTAKRIYPDYISAKKQREIHKGNTVPVMWCRNMLWEWQDENWNYKYYWRFNWWVVTLNFVKLALEAKWDINKFWDLFEEYTEILKEALLYKHWLLRWVKAKSSPIHWQYWALARLWAEDVIDPYLYWKYCSMWAWFIWLYETVYLLTWEKHTDNWLAYEILSKFRNKCDKWSDEYNIAFWCYATPAEQLCKTFHDKDREVYWVIENVTDKWYYTNWFMVDWRQPISAFDKLKFEADFQPLAKAWCISYIETCNLEKNPQAVLSVMKFIYDNIIYAWINRQSNVCHVCWFDWDINVVNNKWTCPNCGNCDRDKMTITVRICWYLSETVFNTGKENEIMYRERVLHL